MLRTRLLLAVRHFSAASSQSHFVVNSAAKHKSKTAFEYGSRSFRGPFARKVFECRSLLALKQLKSGRQLDSLEYCVVLRRAVDLGELQWAVCVFEEAWKRTLSGDRCVDNVLVATALSALLRMDAGLPKALKLCRSLAAAGLRPTHAMYASLISHCGRSEHLQLAETLFQEYLCKVDTGDVALTSTSLDRRQSLGCEKRDARERSQMSQVWNSMLHAYKCAMKYDRCVALFREMTTQRKLEAESSTLTTVLSSMSARIEKRLYSGQTPQQTDGALLKDVIETQHKCEELLSYWLKVLKRSPQSSMFSAMMNSYAISMDLAQCLRLEAFLNGHCAVLRLRNGCRIRAPLALPKPNDACIGALLKCLARIRTKENAIAWNSALKAEVCAQNEELLRSEDNLTAVCRRLECELRSRKCSDQTCFGLLIHCFGELDARTDLKKALQTYERMTDGGVAPNSLTLQNLTHCALNHFYDRKPGSSLPPERQSQLTAFMRWLVAEFKTHKVKPHRGVYKLLRKFGVPNTL